MKNDPLFDIASFISETIYRNNNLINHFLHEFSLTITDVKINTKSYKKVEQMT